MSYALTIELDVAYSTWSEAGSLAERWLQQGLEKIEPGWLAEVGNGRIVGAVRTFIADGNIPASRAYSIKAVRDACSRIDKLSMCEVGVYRLADDGGASGEQVTMTVHNPEEGPGILKLSSTFYAQEEVVNSDRFRRRIEFLREYCDTARVLFGHVSYHMELEPITALERGLNLMSTDTIGMMEEFARGYSWITILSESLALRIGGKAALASSGAFVAVDELNCGAVWLQATERWDQYGMNEVGRLFNVVRPILLRGTPKPSPLRRYSPDMPPELVIFEAP